MSQLTELLPLSGPDTVADMIQPSPSSPSTPSPATATSAASHPSQSENAIEIAVTMDRDLLRQIQHLTDDPSKVIEVAVRQWLRGGARRDDDLTRNLDRNPPVPTKGEWND